MAELSDRERKIYDILQDEKSEEVFIARHNYAKKETQVFQFANVMTDCFYDAYEKNCEWHTIIKRLSNNKYILYGAGRRARRVINVLKHYNCIDNCVEIWDKNTALHGTKMENIKITGVGAKTWLVLLGVSNIEPTELSRDLGIPEEMVISSDLLLTNDEEQYFDKEIIVSRLGNSEIFVDAGCFDFLTSERFLKHSPGTEKIYAFEPDEILFEGIQCRITESGFGNVQFEKCALWSEDTMLQFSSDVEGAASCISDVPTNIAVKARALDNLIPSDGRVTFIKMDVEGAEMGALKGAKETIKRCKPKLAISVYHKRFDYLDIPEYIISLVPEYKFYLRHYKLTSAVESVLYCVI